MVLERGGENDSLDDEWRVRQGGTVLEGCEHIIISKRLIQFDKDIYHLKEGLDVEIKFSRLAKLRLSFPIPLNISLSSTCYKGIRPTNGLNFQ